MGRILNIGFGYEPFWHGGMVTYQSDMMEELQTLGHDITFLAAGRFDMRRKPYLARRKHRRMDVIELVNSPNPYDPYCYRTNPDRHCRHETIEQIVRNVIETIRPDLVHFHDLRMHCASIIAITRDLRIPMVKTIHNFWDLCPKDDLLFMDRIRCDDIDGGTKCRRCLRMFPEKKLPISTRIKGTMNHPILVTGVEPLWKIVRKASPAERTATASESINFPPRAYKERRRYFVEMLNICDAIHVTSRYCSDRLAGSGIEKQKIKIVPLSVRLLSGIRPKPDHAAGRPVTFGYRGLLHRRKGIHILLSAFARLDQRKCRLVIMGQGDMSLIAAYRRKDLSVEFRGHYRPSDIQDSMKDIDVGVVPSMWEEPFGIVGLEYLNARIPVIASNIGGITEWLHDGTNGFLFEPGNVDDLLRAMHKFIDEPQSVRQMQQKIESWKMIREHALEIDNLYKMILRGR